MPRRGCRPCWRRGTVRLPNGWPTIKGLPATSAQGPVQAAAAELERDPASTASGAEAAQSTLDERLTALVGGLRQALGVEEEPGDLDRWVAARPRRRWRRDRSDAGVPPRLRRSRDRPSGGESGPVPGGVPPDALAQLQAHLEAFAFDEALALLAGERTARRGAVDGVAASPAEHYDRDRDGARARRARAA